MGLMGSVMQSPAFMQMAQSPAMQQMAERVSQSTARALKPDQHFQFCTQLALAAFRWVGTVLCAAVGKEPVSPF
jgi:hypothetical protein